MFFKVNTFLFDVCGQLSKAQDSFCKAYNRRYTMPFIILTIELQWGFPLQTLTIASHLSAI